MIISSIVIIVIKIVFLLGFLILIHEGGHFLIAKLCKIKVNEFAIGFGPTLWKKKGKETKYALRLIPLGGYVNMEGEEERSENEGSFSKASIPKRIAIVLAGGMVNIIFGLILYFGLTFSTSDYVSNIIKEVRNVSTNTSQLQNGDEIIKINNKQIHLKSDIDKALENSNGEKIDVLVKKNGKLLEIKSLPNKKQVKSIGAYLGKTDENLGTQIVGVQSNSPAENAGIQAKDLILKVNGQDVNNDIYKAIDLINKSVDKNIELVLQRKNEQITVRLETEVIPVYYLDISLKEAQNTLINKIYYGYWTTVDFSLSIIDNLKMLFTGQIKTNQLMGPIGISEVVADTTGIQDFVYILALISLSLGVTNLLPIPPLDGGKIVILLIEAARRKPMKIELEAGIQMVGFIVMILLSIYVTYNDILRIF